MKYLVLAVLAFLLYLAARHLIRRKLRALRGEPEPQTTGPRNITLIAVAIIVVYGLWMAVRLLRF